MWPILGLTLGDLYYFAPVAISICGMTKPSSPRMLITLAKVLWPLIRYLHRAGGARCVLFIDGLSPDYK
jgi:hypothetical protein